MFRRRDVRGSFSLLLALAGVGIIPSPGLALDPDRPLDQALVHQWTTDRGLPQASVTSIHQDSIGFLWVATLEGVARFDGLRFVRPRDLRGDPLPGEPATTLALDAVGDVWIGTLGLGLRWWGATGHASTMLEGLPDDRVFDLLPGADGSILAATGRGIAAIEQRRVVDVWASDTPATSLARLGDDPPWVGTAAGLRRLSGDALVAAPNAAVLEGVPIRDLLVDGATLWIGTLGRGLGRLDADGIRLFATDDGVTNLFVSALALEGSCLWIGTRSGLLRRCGGRSIEAFPEGHVLADAVVLSVFVDRDGDLWVGTQTDGLIRLRDAPIGALDRRSGLADTMISSVSQAADGTILVGTTGAGVGLVGPQGSHPPGIAAGLPTQRVTAVLPDPSGAIWIGTSGGGVVEWRDGVAAIHGTSSGALASNFILSLFLDSNGALWVGTNTGGVSRLEGGEWTRWGTDQGLPTVAVMAFAQDSAGGIWVATQRGLVFSADRGATSWQAVDVPYALLTSLATDGDRLWIGTLGGGLLAVDANRSVARIGTAEGLPASTVWTLLWRGDELWMSGNHGVWRVHRAALLEALEGTPLPAVAVLDADDGMPASECNGGTQPAGWVAHDGKLLFPTIAGVAVVDPQRLDPAAAPKALIVEELRIDGRIEAAAAEVRLPAGTRTLEIGYTAVALRDPDSVRFRYRLNGYDETWIDAGSRRAAHYTRVPPGRYSFEVEAGRIGADWTAAAPITLDLAPLWFQRRSVQAGAALALLLVIGGIPLLRLRLAAKRRRELERVVAERTEALRQANRTLEDLAARDGLTGLATRRRFDETLASEWSRHARDRKPLAIVLADVDAFKRYNDSLGHVAGDECLRRVAAVFGAAARRPGDLAARYGGEELVLLLGGADEHHAAELAENVRAAVATLALPHPSSPTAPHVTVSVGVAVAVPEADSDATALVAAADGALYAAKENGRNRVETA